MLACSDDSVARMEPLNNFNLPGAPQAQADFNAFGQPGSRLARCRFVGRRWIVKQLDHKLPCTLGNDRLFRHHQRIFANVKHHIDPRKHAGA